MRDVYLVSPANASGASALNADGGDLAMTPGTLDSTALKSVVAHDCDIGVGGWTLKLTGTQACPTSPVSCSW